MPSAITPASRPTVKFKLQFVPGIWSDVSRDIRWADGIQSSRGINGTSPNDRVADTGILSLALNNSHTNSAGVASLYSPDSVFCRPGFEIGMAAQLEIMHESNPRKVWTGTVDDISVEVGILGTRRTRIACVDWMEEAATHGLSGLATMLDVRADAVAAAVIAAVPVQPYAVSLSTGTDVWPYALDRARDENDTAMSELAKIYRSELGQFYIKGDGTARGENRGVRTSGAAAKYELRGTFKSMSVRRARRDIINKVRSIVHPRRVDVNYSVLYSLDDTPLITPGTPLVLKVNYTNPNVPGQRTGALDVQTPVAGSDYIASVTTEALITVPDAVADLVPTGEGTDTAWELNGGGSKTAAVADDSDATTVRPTANGGLTAQTFLFTPIANAVDTAPVASVRLVYRVYHQTGGSVFYPRVRLSGIVLDLETPDKYFDTGTAGYHDVEVELPRPGGGPWTVSDVNSAEFGGRFNWSSQAPEIPRMRVRVAYASTVSVPGDDDRTSDLLVTVDPGGNAATITVSTLGAAGSYLKRLVLRGRIVTALEPATSELLDSASIIRFGERTATLDMDYQSSVTIGVSAAAYINSLYRLAKSRIESVTFCANLSDTHMRAALDGEISDKVKIVDIISGISAVHHINSIALNIQPGVIWCTWTLTPADPTLYWHVGVPGQSEVGTMTVGPL